MYCEVIICKNDTVGKNGLKYIISNLTFTQILLHSIHAFVCMCVCLCSGKMLVSYTLSALYLWGYYIYNSQLYKLSFHFFQDGY